MNDAKIIAAIKTGDSAAINNVINKYFKLIWSIVSAILKNVASTQDIEECVADVFIYLWENSGKYDAQRGKLKVWLCVVARSRAINRYHQIVRRVDISLDETTFVAQMDLVDGISAEETKHMLLAAIQSLDEPDQEILIRRYYYDQKPKEIAIALDRPVKHIENRLYRTKKKLRNMISVENGGLYELK